MQIRHLHRRLGQIESDATAGAAVRHSFQHHIRRHIARQIGAVHTECRPRRITDPGMQLIVAVTFLRPAEPAFRPDIRRNAIEQARSRHLHTFRIHSNPHIAARQVNIFRNGRNGGIREISLRVIDDLFQCQIEAQGEFKPCLHRARPGHGGRLNAIRGGKAERFQIKEGEDIPARPFDADADIGQLIVFVEIGDHHLLGRDIKIAKLACKTGDGDAPLGQHRAPVDIRYLRQRRIVIGACPAQFKTEIDSADGNLVACQCARRQVDREFPARHRAAANVFCHPVIAVAGHGIRPEAAEIIDTEIPDSPRQREAGSLFRQIDAPGHFHCRAQRLSHNAMQRHGTEIAGHLPRRRQAVDGQRLAIKIRPVGEARPCRDIKAKVVKFKLCV